MKSTGKLLVVLGLLLALVTFGVAAHLPHAHKGGLSVGDCVFCQAHGVSVEPMAVAGGVSGPVPSCAATLSSFDAVLPQGMPLIS